jgi:hypothetical protein
MAFLKKVFGSGDTSSSSEFYIFNVRCDRCGETIEGRVNLANDLSADDDGGYRVRKVLIGSSRCFQQIEVTVRYDAARQLQEKQISGGKFVE